MASAIKPNKLGGEYAELKEETSVEISMVLRLQG